MLLKETSLELQALLAPATVQLLEMLRSRGDVAIELFDLRLTPLLPRSSSPTTAVLHQGAGGAHGGIHAHLQAAVQGGQRQMFTHGDLEIALYPLRRVRKVIGILALARPAAGAQEAGGADVVSSLEPLGQTLRSTLEADINSTVRLEGEHQRSRRLTAILRFLGHLLQTQSDRELLRSVVQAAAVWYDLDARAYRQDLSGRFVIDTWLPGADPALFPRELPASLVASPVTTRISTVLELEQIGWRNPTGELLLVPVSHGDRPQFLIALCGSIDAEVESTFAVISAALAVTLDRLAAVAARDLQEVVLHELVREHESMSGRLHAILGHLARAVDADRTRIFYERSPGAVTVIAAAGAPWEDEPPPALESERTIGEPDRLAFVLAIGATRRALLELRPAAGLRFSFGHARLAEAGAAALEVWLAGALGSLDEGMPNGASEHFERRMQVALARADRLNLEAGLLVFDVDRAPSAIDRSTYGSLIRTLREDLRASDLIGRLDAGDVGVLVQAGAEGLASVTGRVKRRLAEVTRTRALPGVRLGAAAFPSGCESASALLDEARRVAGLAPAFAEGENRAALAESEAGERA